MSCYHPLFGIVRGVNPDTGKQIITVHSYGSEDVSRFLAAGHSEADLLRIPCGRCIGCRLDKSREWANRCLLELQYHDSAYFVTLTYDDFHVPRNFYYSGADKKKHMSLTLCKRDFQLWMKRLRKAFPEDSIRFLAAGEYGSHTFRPHYHVILFGLHLDDLQAWKVRGDYTYYNSPRLSATWALDGREFGHVVVAPVTWQTCAYVARYTAKKDMTMSPEDFHKLGLEPPFLLMSRRPGLGRDYYDNHPDLYNFQNIPIFDGEKGRKLPIPHYYDYLEEKNNPEVIAALKEQRKKAAIERQRLEDEKSDLFWPDRLSIRERNQQKRAAALIRPLEE